MTLGYSELGAGTLLQLIIIHGLQRGPVGSFPAGRVGGRRHEGGGGKAGLSLTFSPGVPMGPGGQNSPGDILKREKKSFRKGTVSAEVGGARNDL